MQSIASQRLRELLDYWPDTCMSIQAFTELHDAASIVKEGTYIPPAVHNWDIFEEIVFDNRFAELDPDQWLMQSAWAKTYPSLWEMVLFPFEFFAWSRKSRRSFELPKDLQRMFAMATYPKVLWEDVTLPFDSFVITLEEPLMLEDAPGVWAAYDSIMTTRLPDGIINLRLMRRPLADAEKRRFPERAIQRMKILQKRDPAAARDYIIKKINEWEDALVYRPGWRRGPLFLPDQMTPQTRVKIEAIDLALDYRGELEGGAEEQVWMFGPLSWAAKIVVGWCLYLESLSSSQLSWREERHRTDYGKRGQRGLTGIITSTDHICTMIGSGSIDPSSYGLHENKPQPGASYFVRPHWRRAHKRREPGTPPNAPKTVKIPPLLIRKDLVPMFGIIGGTRTKVLPED